jgi:hypothetical protein
MENGKHIPNIQKMSRQSECSGNNIVVWNAWKPDQQALQTTLKYKQMQI